MFFIYVVKYRKSYEEVKYKILLFYFRGLIGDDYFYKNVLERIFISKGCCEIIIVF